MSYPAYAPFIIIFSLLSRQHDVSSSLSPVSRSHPFLMRRRYSFSSVAHDTHKTLDEAQFAIVLPPARPPLSIASEPLQVGRSLWHTSIVVVEYCKRTLDRRCFRPRRRDVSDDVALSTCRRAALQCKGPLQVVFWQNVSYVLHSRSHSALPCHSLPSFLHICEWS